MKHRDFLKSSAAVTGGVFAGLGRAAVQSDYARGPVPGPTVPDFYNFNLAATHVLLLRTAWPRAGVLGVA
jgi:hypothetical protein